MKKAILVTRHAIPNYGSLLQAYASVQLFHEKGYDVKILDYIPIDEIPRRLYRPMMKGSKFAKRQFLKYAYITIRMPDFWIMGSKFRKFQKDLLPLTKTFHNSSDLRKETFDADIYITGSDQVWGPIALNEYDPNYFFDFLPKDKKRLAYSASFGNTKFSNSVMTEYKKMLGLYEKIMVREKSAISLLDSLGFSGVHQVLDPTLMFNKSFWESKITTIPRRDKYVLVYQVHDNKNMEIYAKQLSEKLGYKLVRLSNSFAHIIRGGKFEYLPEPGRFLNLIRNAEYVVTNSFHATVFSLIFERPFSIIHSGETNTRINSLLNLVQLEERQIKDFDDFSQITKMIDYTLVRQVIEQARTDSDTIINNCLKEID